MQEERSTVGSRQQRLLKDSPNNQTTISSRIQPLFNHDLLKLCLHDRLLVRSPCSEL
jgi:hypothetical protein